MVYASAHTMADIIPSVEYVRFFISILTYLSWSWFPSSIYLRDVTNVWQTPYRLVD